jgi:hypothetical protein
VTGGARDAKRVASFLRQYPRHLLDAAAADPRSKTLSQTTTFQRRRTTAVGLAAHVSDGKAQIDKV